VKSSENVVVNNMRKVNRVINGRARQFVVSPDRVLLDVLREDLHLTGTCASVPAMWKISMPSNWPAAFCAVRPPQKQCVPILTAL
jgi:hypothetical protein